VPTTQQTAQPLVYLTGPHWPVIVSWPWETYLETVTAPTHADAVRSAAYIYQGATSTKVIPLTVAERITAPADTDPSAPPVAVQLAQALLASHAPEYTIAPSAAGSADWTLARTASKEATDE
jgi:hypothetical protein